MTVGGLIVGQPFQSRFHGGLRLGRAAMTLYHVDPVGRHAKSIGVGHRLLSLVAPAASGGRQFHVGSDRGDRSQAVFSARPAARPFLRQTGDRGRGQTAGFRAGRTSAAGRSVGRGRPVGAAISGVPADLVHHALHRLQSHGIG